MPEKNPHHSDDARGDGTLYEFFDEAHEVTEEERNRPRYGRPLRKPEVTQPESKQEPPVENPGS